MNDYYLKYIFTDRAGRGVYNILNSRPNLVKDNNVHFTEDKTPLGQIRLEPGKDEISIEWSQPK